jgi:uncharacterized membrane protein
VAGFAAYLTGQLLLAAVSAPPGAARVDTYALLGLAAVLNAFGAGLLAMLAESLVALHIDRLERSRIVAVQRTAAMRAVAQFGWAGGLLSRAIRSFPFYLSTALLALGCW